MSDQLLHIHARGTLRHTLMLLPLALALVGAWFSVRWYVGDSIAEYMNPDDNGLKTAQLAVTLAPKDPLVHWRLAEVEQSKLPQDQLARAIKEYEQAVGLAPNDYRFWLALGRALEQSGDTQKAESAMR